MTLLTLLSAVGVAWCASSAMNMTQYGVLFQFLMTAQARPVYINTTNCPYQIDTANRVACNAAGGIAQLQLNRCILSGNLTGGLLEQLTDLTYLNLSDNNLAGPIFELVYLTALTALDLSYNALGGDALVVVQSLPALTSCSLQWNAPYDTNCFSGFAAYGSLCNPQNADPLYLCRNYVPEAPQATLPTLTPGLLIPVPESTTGYFSSSSTTYAPTSTVSLTGAPVVTTNTPPTTTMSQVTLTNFTEESVQAEQRASVELMPPSVSGGDQQTVIIILGVLVALLYVAFAGVFFYLKGKRSRRNKVRPLSIGAFIPFLDEDNSSVVSDVRSETRKSVANSSNSQYGRFDLPPEDLQEPPSLSAPQSVPPSLRRLSFDLKVDADGYANLPVMSSPRPTGGNDVATVVNDKTKSLRSRVAHATHPAPFKPAAELVYDVVPAPAEVPPVLSLNYDILPSSAPKAQKTLYDAPESSLEH
jgi:hypothetical protein